MTWRRSGTQAYLRATRDPSGIAILGLTMLATARYFDRLVTSVAANDEPDVSTMGDAYPREYADRNVGIK